MINSNTDICIDPNCQGNIEGRTHGHLSMPDPCPHVTRMDLIAARLSGDPERIADLENCEDCAGNTADAWVNGSDI